MGDDTPFNPMEVCSDAFGLNARVPSIHELAHLSHADRLGVGGSNRVLCSVALHVTLIIMCPPTSEMPI